MDAYISPETQAELLSSASWQAAYKESVVYLGHFIDGLQKNDGALPKAGVAKSVQTFQIFVIFTLLQFAITWLARWILFEPVARIVLAGKSGRQVKRAKVEKFAQSANEALYYGVYTVFGLLLVAHQEFVWPSERWFPRDVIWDGKPLTVELCVVCYYLLYGSRYVACAVSLLFEHKRKDFWEMMAHHVVTAVVIGISYYIEQIYIGCIVMVLLDPADVPLHIAKLWKYCADVRPNTGFGKLLQLTADICFGIFVVAFFATRICIYPYVCYAPILHDIPKNHGNIACTALLWILQFLQAMWMCLIVKAIANMLAKGGIEDVRSDSEDEDGESKKDK
eukprot:TRINITY_DN24592_c0_g1_i1.p2 TRINITY_DN24592_c0_g1~~TRINITY_DN24592_c0_g1_i1.p2  ORF type:complete len:336 (+),score=153.36 TRINITY_DN24592_c0_g1_i1:47-1054(+)